MKIMTRTLLLLTALAVGAAYGGIDGGGRSRGAVKRFGSIFVTGVEYFTESASFSINGLPGAQADLKIGQIVDVVGSVDSGGLIGRATSVVYRDTVRGVVTSVDAASSSFVVLGQTVRVNGGTTFDASIAPATLNGIAKNMRVAISGYTDGSGEVIASEVEAQSGGSWLAVVGYARDIDLSTSRLRINGLVVDFSSANLPTGLPAEGNLLDVHGLNLRADGSLLATRIESLPAGLGGQAGERDRIEGYVTAYVAGIATLNGQDVIVSGATQFENGSAADLAVNRKIEAEGRLDSSGRILAEKIKFEFVGSSAVLGAIESLDPAHSSARVLGANVIVDGATRTQDKSDQNLRELHYSDLRSGDFLEISGVQIGPTTLRAERLNRIKPTTALRLEGQGSVTARQSVLVLGQEIFTNSKTRFRASSGPNLTAAQFFALAANSNVAAKAINVGGVIVASELQLIP
jgi:Domain of unknown function (DUF5666)